MERLQRGGARRRGHAHADGDGYSYGYANTDGDPHRNADRHGHTECDRYRVPDGDTDRDAIRAAPAVAAADLAVGGRMPQIPSGGYNNTAELLVGQNGLTKSLLKFDVATIPITATVDEATLQLYYTSRSNGNTLKLGAHRVLADWVDSQANWTQRQTGANWAVAGMGSGSDYAALPDGTADVGGPEGAWVDLNVTNMVQAWVANAANNAGMVVLQNAASDYVVYHFCSELGWGPSCSAALAPKLTIWYH